MLGRVSRGLAVLCWTLVSTAGHVLPAQTVTRDNYFQFLPPPPRLISQTRESAAHKLFGDRASPAFRDVAPLNGVDDERDRVLLRIAARFAPLMRPNNFVVPVDPRALLGEPQRLISDLWVNGKLAQSDTLLLSQSPHETSVVLQSSDGGVAHNDAVIDRLLAARGPHAALSQIIPADADSDRVIYFDFRGTDRRSWRKEYKDADLRSKLHVFVHPFVTQAPGANAGEVMLYLQYWFFYPFNDAVNAHEGDWEHINVRVTTRAKARSARRADLASLSVSELERILAGELSVDSLAIAQVEYCFHEMFIQLDYIALTSDSTPPRPKDAHRAWEDLGYVRDVVRKRVSVGRGILATHPVVYIGGDHRGPDELFTFIPKFHASLKRNSGASYPFPGTWRTVAGFGVTETVFGRSVPALKSDTTLAWYDAIMDDAYIPIRPEHLELLPDWEVLASSFDLHQELRRAWAWMLVPAHFGFPVTPSLGGGIVRHANIGNVAPVSPTFNEGWNRQGAGPYRAEYKPRVVRTPVSPNTPWAIVRNGWGFFNIPFALWGLMPGYNVGLIELMPWASGTMHILGAPPPRTFVQDRLPPRFTSAGAGVHWGFGEGHFAKMIPTPSGTIGASKGSSSDVLGPRFWFNLFFGDRFSVENSYGWSRSDIAYLAADPTRSYLMSGSLEMRQLTGGFRWDAAHLNREHSRFFTRAGYGWLWYRATNQRIDGVSLGASPPHQGAIPPLLPAKSWMPNTVYGGGGWEWFTLHNYWLFGLLGTGFRVEYTEYLNQIQYGNGRSPLIARGDLALSLVFGW